MNDEQLHCLSNDETIQLEEDAFILFETFLNTDPLFIMYPKFEEDTTEHIHEILNEQLNGLVLNKNLYKIIEKAKGKYYKYNMPRRSYKKTFIRTGITHQADVLKNKIIYLQNVPQPDQRTDEWYEFRHKFLTASSSWKAFSTQSAKNQLIYGKCCPLDTKRYKVCDITTPMHHGNKYEPVSIMYYEKTYKTQISDFGCIPHQTHNFLAASPDGINTDEKSGLYGRMLEVKNIVNRVIDGNPKFEYWVQMQLQMETCNLHECDFLETQFTEYKTIEDFESDGSFTRTEDGKLKGIIMRFSENDMPFYEYCPLEEEEEGFKKWEAMMLEKHKDKLWIKNIYWYLDKISNVLVLRNKYWFKNALPVLKSLWETIQKEKEGDYSHRAPRKKAPYNPFSDIKSSKCYLHLGHVAPAPTKSIIKIDTEKLSSQNTVHTVHETHKN
jgi:putative phage-type endonuclease